MSTPYVIQTIIDILLAAILVWSILNEEKLIIFEDKIVNKWKSRKTRR